MAAKQGLETTGIDSAPAAIEIARRKAQERGLNVRFRVHNALDLSSLGEQFDTVIDSGLWGDDSAKETREYSPSLAHCQEPHKTSASHSYFARDDRLCGD